MDHYEETKSLDDGKTQNYFKILEKLSRVLKP